MQRPVSPLRHDYKPTSAQSPKKSRALQWFVVGLGIPLAFSMASSISVWEVLIWGPVTLVLQLVAYRLTDLVLKDLPSRIVDGEMGPALLLVSIKLAVAAVNAAAVTA